MTTKKSPIIVNNNGRILSSEETSISILDHGFLFGDSVYEVIATHKGVLCFAKEHLERLAISADGISLNIPWSHEDIIEEIKKTIDFAGFDESYIRIIITRGIGDISLDPYTCCKPNRFIIIKRLTAYDQTLYRKGIKISIVPVKRNPKECINPGIKTGNYLNNILALIEAKKKGAYDGLMLNKNGFVSECTTSNIFSVKDNIISTPSISCGILQGITRSTVISVAKDNDFNVIEKELEPSDILNSDELFITSTTKGIMPVTTCDNTAIGSGIPGETTNKLSRLYCNYLNTYISNIS